MNIVVKTWKHFCLVNKHRWTVFKLCCKVGLPWRGFVHDISKYSPTEFWESVKYFNGQKSPISQCRANRGYSLAWIHHKGRNKHHFEYWEDVSQRGRIPVQIPYEYAVESICDKVAAGMVYRGKDWTPKEVYEYWERKEKNSPIQKNSKSVAFVDTVLRKIADEGIDAGLNKKYLKEIYDVTNK